MNRLLIALLLLLLTAPATADTITGKPKISDGDTFKIREVKIRIFGIDAPETRQSCKDSVRGCYRCGQEATRYMKNLVGNSAVTCEFTGAKTFDRKVAACTVGDKDVALEMIKAGWAIVYKKYLRDLPEKRAPYLAAESQAKKDRVGIWRGSFVVPEKWRTTRRLGCN